MAYAVKWTENGKKRELVMEYKPLAVIMLNRIIIDCHHYDAKLVSRKS